MAMTTIIEKFVYGKEFKNLINRQEERKNLYMEWEREDT